jgi:NAD(P)-dependent dehydrogenase (short-subunit alcohol dehydrogenase family)
VQSGASHIDVIAGIAMTQSMAGACVVVTGGGSGIGAATCRLIAGEGGQVAVLGRTAQTIEHVASECGGIAKQVDVRDAEQVQRAIDEAAAQMGGLTGLCNNAGTGNIVSLHQTTPGLWERTVAVNLAGVFHGMRAAVPLLLAGGGAIVNVASISGVRPSPGEGVYAASKAGVVALSASAALEYAPHIRVNCVSPGVVRTNMTEPLLDSDESTLRAAIPLGRLGSAEEIAEVIVFLLSERSAWITGQNVVVDGGTTLHGSGVEGVARTILEGGQ